MEPPPRSSLAMHLIIPPIILQSGCGSFGMEVYDFCENRNQDAHVIEGVGLNSHFTNTNLEQTEVMINEEASKIASTYSGVFTVKTLDMEKCKELKMGPHLTTAAASANPPHFIHQCYKPPTGPVNFKLALVGKVFGATKDFGQIKPLGVQVLLQLQRDRSAGHGIVELYEEISLYWQEIGTREITLICRPF